MNKEELGFEEFLLKLLRIENMDDASEAFHIYKEVLFGLSIAHQDISGASEQQRDMKIILQMMFTKVATLETHLYGIEFRSSLFNKNLNNIIDSTIVSSAVRGIFETVGMFNTVFVQPQTEEQRVILYNLWVIAGLKYRQGFNSLITLQKHLEKSETEKAKIELFKTEIFKTVLYSSLDDKSKGIIANKIKSKDYKISIDNNRVTQLSVQEAINKAGLEKTMGVHYNYFSLSAHPTYVGVFQFRQLFDTEKPQYIEMTLFNIDIALKLISVFIADYIKVFPTVGPFFKSLPLLHKSLIQTNNTKSRGNKYIIK